MKKYFIAIVLLALVVLPGFAFAQLDPDYCLNNPNDPFCSRGNTGGTGSGTTLTTCGSDNLGDILCNIAKLLNAIIPILFALAMVYFVYGVVVYFIADEEEAKQKGRNSIVFGIIGLAVIISVWGLVQLVRSSFGVSNGNTPTKTELQNLLPH